MVPISSVTTSCDCTKANASKTYFEPHETGSIKVHIDFLGKKVDQVSKIIVISIENGQDTAMILKVAVKFRSTEEDDKVTPAQNKDRKKEP